MAERIEFVGNPLPTGLPGFGGGTVSVLVLPGFNTVVAVQKFGPVVDAPTVTPPDPEPPTGSNPEDPTDEVVDPGPAPQPGSSTPPRGTFCERCVPPEFNITNFPLMMAIQAQSGCFDCQGGQPGTVAQPDVAAYSVQQGIFWDGNSGIIGKAPNGYEWKVTDTQLNLDGSSGGTVLNDSFLLIGQGGGLETYYEAGPTIKGPDGKEYKPQDLEVCNGTNTETWKVLAWKP
jgi:hypothetical protein